MSTLKSKQTLPTGERAERCLLCGENVMLLGLQRQTAVSAYLYCLWFSEIRIKEWLIVVFPRNVIHGVFRIMRLYLSLQTKARVME